MSVRTGQSKSLGRALSLSSRCPPPELAKDEDDAAGQLVDDGVVYAHTCFRSCFVGDRLRYRLVQSFFGQTWSRV